MAFIDSAAEIFRKLTDELSAFLENEGILVRPYANPQLVFFQQMPRPQQLEMIAGLRHYLEASQRVRRAGRSLKEARNFVEVALEYYGFKTHPEVFDRAFEPHVVTEFYSLSGMQIFRTFNYFELTSYTLEDIYCRQWVHLYERPEAVVQKMYHDIESLILSQSATRTLEFGPHPVEERVSLERLKLHCDGMHISPLTKEGKVVGMTSLIQVRPVQDV